MTSIEWLIEELDELIPYGGITTSQLFDDVLAKAKEMHKKEIEQSFIDGRFSGCGCYNYMKESDPEKYYKQIFKS
jgi:hypothetical protein